MNARPNNSSSKAIHGSSSNGMWIALGALAVVLVLGIAGFVVATKYFNVGQREAVNVDLAQTADEKIKIDDSGAITVGDSSAPKLDIYEDFMCPACGSFEKAYGQQVNQAIHDGKLQVTQHYLNFLDKSSGTGKYSTRAIAGIQCVATKESLDTYLAVRESWFAHQPMEGGGDLTAVDLAKFAKEAGASDDTKKCIEGVESEGGNNMSTASDTASNSLKSMTDQKFQPSTPTLAHDGKVVDFSKDPNWLQNIINSKQ